MLENRLPLLITGVAGVAGFNAFHYFQRRYPGQVVGIRPMQTFRLVGNGILAQEAEDPVGMLRLFDRFGFRSVLNAIGNCALKSCELDPAMAFKVNVASAEVMAENVRRHGARLVHLSSDLVFSGKGEGNYREDAPTDPITIYGKTMVRAEDLLHGRIPAVAILRISLPMGPSFNKHAGAVDWIQSRFRADRPATLYFDEIRSATYCDDLNDVFEKLLANDSAGIFHCGGPRSIALYQIGQVVNRVGGYRAELLKGCPRIDAGPIPPRVGDVSMDSAKLTRELGYRPFRPWPLGEDVMPKCPDWHLDRPESEAGSLQKLQERLYRYPGDLAA